MPGPAELIKTIQHCRAEGASEMGAAYAPVETGQAKRAASRRQGIEIDFHLAAESLAVRGQNHSSFSDSQKVALEHAVEDENTEVARKMVVTYASLTQLRIIRSGVDLSGSNAMGEADEIFYHCGHIVVCETEVPMSPCSLE